MLKKLKYRELPVITIHLYQSDKDALTMKAQEKGMKLATYCRWRLLEILKEDEK